MSAPGGLSTNEKRDRLEEQISRRLASANGKQLRGVGVAFGRDEITVEMIFENGEPSLSLLTVPLAAIRNEEDDR